MSIASEISRLNSAKAAIKAAINTQKGMAVIGSETIDDYAAAIAGLNSPATVTPYNTTVRYSASNTETIQTNDRIRIYGDDNKSYTLAEWNAMFVAAGYNKDNMTVAPIGLRCQFNDVDEVYMFERYDGITYNVSGNVANAQYKLAHSLYNHTLVTGAGSGTDTTTGKAWSVTADGDILTLYEANTKQSWTMKKNCGGVNSHRAFNIADRTESLWAQTEWMRHRFAITSGVATTAEDGTYGVVQILNASGEQSAVGEDFYFWVGPDAEHLTNTNIPAKYNVSNRHAATTAEMTAAIAAEIYNVQKAQGVNMNDTGVNSSAKKVLAPGSKGAETIAVDGYWYIVTPYITNSSATTTDGNKNIADSPAVYWAKSKGWCLPSDSLLAGIWNNKPLCDAIVSYLRNREGRTNVLVIPTGDYTWSGIRYSATACWFVSMSSGTLYNTNTYNRYFVCGSSALQ